MAVGVGVHIAVGLLVQLTVGNDKDGSRGYSISRDSSSRDIVVLCIAVEIVVIVPAMSSHNSSCSISARTDALVEIK
jgi:hypothetical protein